MIRLRGFSDLAKKVLGVSQYTAKREARVTVNSQIGYEKASEREVNEVPPSSVRPYEDIPGPRALPLIGNIFRYLPYIGEYSNLPLLSQMRMLREQYGNVVKLDGLLNRDPMIILFCPKLAEKMYRHQGIWPHRIRMETLQYHRECRPTIFKGQYGLTSSQGQQWYDVRSKVNPHMMQPRAIWPHIERIDQVSNDLITRILDTRDPNNLEVPSSFNNELSKWALEATCSIALNRRLGCLEPNLPKDSEPQQLINSVHEMFDLTYKLEVLPSMWKVYNTRKLKRMFQVVDRLTGIAIKYVDRANKEFSENPTESINNRSVLEKLLGVDEQIGRVMSIDMFMAGVDTTGNATASLLYFLATNPKKQEKLREEVMKLLPNKSLPVTIDVINRISYLKGCIKESLRLFPITIGTSRIMQKDVELGGYLMPKGTSILPCHAVMSMDPKQFPNPDEYIPERWLKNSTEFPSAKAAHPFTYMPFGFGARTCIGKRFAEMEIEILIMKIIRQFKLEWHHGPLQTHSKAIATVASPLQLKVIDL